MLADFFAGSTETLILISKKNGKSTLLAALALHHLVTTPDAECVIAAASRDQAAILFGQAAGFVRRSEQLRKRVRPTLRELRSLRDSGRVRIMASDVDTADGVIPTLALVDELHRHKSTELYGVFRDGLGPRNGRMITISTAGNDELSPLGQMRRAAYELPGLKRNGAHRYARSANGAYVMHEWALDPDDDRDDLDLVKTANPAPWQGIEALRRRHDSPSMTKEQWARFACGVWMQTEGSWIEPEAWDACAGKPTIEPGSEAVTGVDIGQKKDSTAVVTVSLVEGKVHVQASILTPQPGRPIAVGQARAEIARLDGELRLLEVPYDPYKFGESAERLEDELGLAMVEFPQTDARMAPASETLYELIMDGRLVHDGDPELRSQVLASVPAQTERGVRISKRKSKARIDAAVALAMAVDRLMANESGEGPMIEVVG